MFFGLHVLAYDSGLVLICLFYAEFDVWICSCPFVKVIEDELDEAFGSSAGVHCAGLVAEGDSLAGDYDGADAVEGF